MRLEEGQYFVCKTVSQGEVSEWPTCTVFCLKDAGKRKIYIRGRFGIFHAVVVSVSLTIVIVISNCNCTGPVLMYSTEKKWQMTKFLTKLSYFLFFIFISGYKKNRTWIFSGPVSRVYIRRWVLVLKYSDVYLVRQGFG